MNTFSKSYSLKVQNLLANTTTIIHIIDNYIKPISKLVLKLYVLLNKDHTIQSTY